MSKSSGAGGGAVRIVVCVDDTDDLTKETSTGAVAEALARNIALFGGEVELGVTRHQLLLDPRVPYTSHNSAMAFTATITPEGLEAYRREAAVIIRVMSAESADPGLCVGVVPAEGDPWLAELAAFGARAQSDYIAPEEALALAERIPWLRLESLAGTTAGVVGALAGAGLRLGGEDGRFRGRWVIGEHGVEVPLGARKGKGAGKGDGSGGGKGRGAQGPQPEEDGPRQLLRLDRVLSQLRAKVNGDAFIESPQGERFESGIPILSSREAKPVLRHGSLVVLAAQECGALRPLAKRELDALDEAAANAASCGFFSLDNDDEELLAPTAAPSCANCLYRRVTADGFGCMHMHEEEVLL